MDQRVDVAIAVVLREGKILICRRKKGGIYGGYWEFPGGKREGRETLEECLARELREELDISARPMRLLGVIEHDYPHGRVRLHPYLCEHEEGRPKQIGCEATRWIDPAQLRDYRFPEANEGLIDSLLQMLAGH